MHAVPTTLASLGSPPEHGELSLLWRALHAGVDVAPMVVVPETVESAYYRFNNLPERLRALFDGVDLTDPDEDDLEERAPEAEALVRGHALEAEVIEAFYEATVGLPARLLVRRAGTPGVVAGRGRPALLALKRTWSDDWSGAALERRLRGGGGLAPDAAPVVLHDADLVRLDPLPASLPCAVARAWADRSGRIARLDGDDDPGGLAG